MKMAAVCQVTGAGMDALWCEATDSNGYRCERLDEHLLGHAVGQHTIQHSIMGNGYYCDSVGP